MTPRARAEQLVRATRSLADASLRVAYLRDVIRSLPIQELARVLDVVCASAEQAETPAREALIAVVDALNREDEALVQRLREEAVGESLLALERLIRHPVSRAEGAPSRSPLRPDGVGEDRVPDYGKGRPLTLGERKSLARKPNRDLIERLLSDPHPDVIRGVLRNPRITEDDVVRLSAKRPNRPDILAEIAREPRWVHRPRVRLALILNPDTKVEIATAIAGLLMRQELKLVAGSTRVAAGVRALCLEHLERRPPMAGRDDGEREWDATLATLQTLH